MLRLIMPAFRRSKPETRLTAIHQFTVFPLNFVAVQIGHKIHPRLRKSNMTERRVLGRPKMVLNVALWVIPT